MDWAITRHCSASFCGSQQCPGSPVRSRRARLPTIRSSPHRASARRRASGRLRSRPPSARRRASGRLRSRPHRASARRPRSCAHVDCSSGTNTGPRTCLSRARLRRHSAAASLGCVRVQRPSTASSSRRAIECVRRSTEDGDAVKAELIEPLSTLSDANLDPSVIAQSQLECVRDKAVAPTCASDIG